jgi:hypothetical protein
MVDQYVRKQAMVWPKLDFGRGLKKLKMPLRRKLILFAGKTGQNSTFCVLLKVFKAFCVMYV